MLWTFSNHLWILQERSLQSKLELLYKDHLYPLALSVIRSFASSYLEEKEDENILKQRKQEIESMTKQATKMYADHLYSKSQYQEAIEQYILTIGHLEPSYVIRKFLDTQRTSQLSTYVEELHHRQLAGT
jgi:vacuolar protein sorting-associated protein 11